MIEQHRCLQVEWFCNLSLASDLVAIHPPWNLRFARNDDVAEIGVTKEHDGQISKILPSPSRKNIPLKPSGKSALSVCPSRPDKRGARDRHETRGGMRWTWMRL
jgi:hypothetical protein